MPTFYVSFIYLTNNQELLVTTSIKTSKVHMHNTRSSNYNFLLTVRTNIRTKFIFHNGVKLWNNLFHDFFLCKSLFMLKNKLRF